MSGKRLRKIIRQLLLMLYALKKWKYVLLIFQKLTQIVKNKWFCSWSQTKKKKSGNLTVKKLSALLRGIAKHQGDFYCLNCLHSFATKNKLKSLKKVCENKNFCETIKPSPKDNILQFYQYIKSDNCMHYLCWP